MSLSNVTEIKQQDTLLEDLNTLADRELFATVYMRLPAKEREIILEKAKKEPTPFLYMINEFKTNYYSETEWNAIQEEKVTTILIKFLRKLWNHCPREQKQAFVTTLEKFMGKSMKSLAKQQLSFIK